MHTHTSHDYTFTDSLEWFYVLYIFNFMYEIARILILFLMLGITSYFDLKYREISDKYWLIFGVVGLALYLFDWEYRSNFDGIAIAITLSIALLMWRYFPIGKSDILAFVCIGIILPTVSEIVIVPIVLLGLASILAGIFTVCYNVILNTKDHLLSFNGVFSGFDEPFFRKVIALFMIHKKRDREKFVASAEKVINHKRKFCLGMKNPDTKFSTESGFVESATPLLPYMLAAYVVLIWAFS